jgi:DNA-binding transcriptional MerR regulator
MYYTIGQVSNISELPQSVLRYWETVFDVLKPLKSDGGTRQYSEADIELILKIKKLLYNDGFTIKGANRHLSEPLEITENNLSEYEQIKSEEAVRTESNIKPDKKTENQNWEIRSAPVLQNIITELKSILKILDQ